MQENKVPKCSETEEAHSLILSNILNGPEPKTCMFESPYIAIE